MNTYALLVTLGLGCVSLTGCSGHNVDLDNAAAAGAAGASGRIDTVILRQPNDPIASHLSVDDARLYWITAGGRVQSCIKTNCANTVLTYAGGASIFNTSDPDPYSRVSASGGSVFWIGSDPTWTILSCPVAGCASSPTRIYRDSQGVHGLVSDAEYAYWASDIDLYRCKSSGCGPTPELVVAGTIPSPLVSGQSVYWVGASEAGFVLKAAPKNGIGPARTLVSRTPSDFTVNADTLFWKTDHNQILRCPLPDCTGDPTLVVGDLTSYTSDLLADDTRVYWRDEENVLKACSITGCQTPVTVSSTQVGSFTVDSDFVYWSEEHEFEMYQGLNLHRLPKSAL